MLSDPAFWAATLISILVAVAVPLAIEYIRRPILRVELDEPIVDSQWSIAHVSVRNLPMAERGWLARILGRWLTALAAEGCSLRVFIFRGDPPIGFDGKWRSRQEPISTAYGPSGFVGDAKRIDYFDPQKLTGIHEITLQPGRGDLVTIAIRERGAANAYAYWAERIYAQAGGRPFPAHPDAELPPGSYRVEVRGSAGEVQSPWEAFQLTVEDDAASVSLGSPG